MERLIAVVGGECSGCHSDICCDKVYQLLIGALFS